MSAMWNTIVTSWLNETFYGDTPLHIAINNFEGDIGLVKSLLEHDNDSQINTRNLTDESPLHLAVRNKSCSVELIKLLLEHGADVRAKNLEGDIPLHIAIRNFEGNINLVKFLLEHDNSQVNVRNSNDETSLLLAVRTNKRLTNELLNLLVEHGADVRATSAQDENTALHWIAIGETIFGLYYVSRRPVNEMAEFLLKHGSDVNARNLQGNTPLHLALRQERIYGTPMRVLLNHGSDVNATNSMGDTPFHLLLRGRIHYFIERFNIFLEETRDINLANSRGETLLHLAIRNKAYAKFWIIKDLLDHGADVNKKDAMGENAYQAYCHFLKKENRRADPMLEILLQAKEQEYMDSSLHVAGLFHRVDIVHRLLKMGANVNALDHFGAPPLAYALVASGDVDKCSTLRLMMDYGADIHQKFNFCDIVSDPCRRYPSFIDFIKYVLCFEHRPSAKEIFLVQLAKLVALREIQIEKGFYVEVLSERLTEEYYHQPIRIHGFEDDWISCCSKELKTMSETEVVGESRLSFLDLLLASAEKVATCAKNKELMKAFHAKKVMFPMYQGMLDAKLAKELERQKLVESAAVKMSDAFSFADPSDEFFERTLSYCSNKDLVHVIEAMRYNKE